MSKIGLIRWIFQPIVVALTLVPLALLVQGALANDLGANPLESVEHETGIWALRFLLATLAITPLRKLIGMPELMRFRRTFGLVTFLYASLHFLVWLFLDLELSWGLIGEAILERPFITVGFLAWLIMLPLAITSFNFMIRRLGKRWRVLHKMVYPVGILGVLHFVWLVKADLREPLIYAAILAILLILRLPRVRIPQLAFGSR